MPNLKDWPPKIPYQTSHKMLATNPNSAAITRSKELRQHINLATSCSTSPDVVRFDRWVEQLLSDPGIRPQNA